MPEHMEKMLENLKPLTRIEIVKFKQDVYSAAIREWVAWKCRNRGHVWITRHDVKDCSFGENHPYGSDVTPPEDPELSLVCQIRYSKGSERWHTHEEEMTHISPGQFVLECSMIARTISERDRQQGHAT